MPGVAAACAAALIVISGGLLVLASPASSGETASVAPTPASLPATFNWSILTLAHAPSNRSEFAFAWGPGFALFFGGRFDLTTLMNDTWKFAGGNWTQLHPHRAPSPRRGAMMIFDPAERGFVLFGGATNDVYYNDTWLFHAGQWSRLALPHAPGPRRVGGFAWDASDGYGVLFSGHDGANRTGIGQAGWHFFDDTWAFQNGSWTELHPTVSPPFRAESSMAFDPVVQQVVLFGGYQTYPGYHGFNDTWTFRAGTWTERRPSGSQPLPRDGAIFVWDPALRGFVMEGGQNESNSTYLEFNDTWLLTSSSTGWDWQLLSVFQPAVRQDSANAVYVPPLGAVVMFGGRSVFGTVWFNATYELT